MEWTATGTRFDRIDGTEDHTEILTAGTTRDDAKRQAQADARLQEDEPTTLAWTEQADGTATARTAHNLYTIQPM
jgi:hypothetical protein